MRVLVVITTGAQARDCALALKEMPLDVGHISGASHTSSLIVLFCADREVVETMLPYMSAEFGNPSSAHYFGRRTKAGIEQARRAVAGLLGCQASEVSVFAVSCCN